MYKIVVADVLYTQTDETFYVQNKLNRDIEKYQAKSLEESFLLLERDGWERCGKVNKNDYSLAYMFRKGSEYIAVWDE